MTYPNAIFSTFAFIGFLMCMVTIPWQLEAWNTGTCVYMAWAGLACLNMFVNSVVWNGNYVNWSPIWCDISTRFTVGLNIAIPAASLCISRRLYYISSLKSVTVTKADKRRHVIVDLSIGVGLPILDMALYYIVQGHRFDIIEDFGCAIDNYNTWPRLIVLPLPPLLIGLISAVYATLNIIQFRKLRAQINEFPGYRNLTTSRFLHFMCLSSVDILFTIPLASYNLYQATQTLSPWISWAYTHYHFSEVNVLPALLWRYSPPAERNLELSRWLVVFCAFVFFGFFGLTAQSRRNYRLCIRAITKRVDLFASRAVTYLTPIAFQSAQQRRNTAHSSDEISASHRNAEDDQLDENNDLEKNSVIAPIGQEDSHRSMAFTDNNLLPISFTNNSLPSSPALPKPALTRTSSTVSSSPQALALAPVSPNSYSHSIV